MKKVLRRSLVLALVGAASVAFAAQVTYNDIASACDPGDPTNGGYWNVQKHALVVVSSEEGSYSGTLDAQPTTLETATMSTLESRYRSDLQSNAIPMTSEPRGCYILIR